MYLTTEQRQGIYLVKMKTGKNFKQIAKELGCNYTLFINALNGKRELPDKYMFQLEEIMRNIEE